MKLKRNVWMFVMLGLFFPFQFVYADECDDIYAEAKGIFAAARKAGKEKNYERTAELYEEAAEYYDKVANMEDCRCPKVPKAAKNNARISMENADKWRQWLEEVAAEEQVIEEYNRARDKFIQGNAYARNRQWDEAIAAFEEAAQIWESVGSSTQSENGKRALKEAKRAWDAANLARKYQKQQ